MGGNCLKNCYTRRFEADEYFSLYRHFHTRFFAVTEMQWSDLIPAYRNKKSFGDMDIIYATYDDMPLDVETIRLVYPDSKEIFRNTNVISLEYNEIQVDLIHIKAEYYDYALDFYAYNDLGNLIGRIAHRFGLKHGHMGLYLPLRDGDNLFHSILLTRDYSHALEFLDLSPNRFYEGFDDLPDMFEYVTSSKWFHPSSYDLAELSHMHRTRDKKRQTYQEFLKYISSYSGEVIDRPKDKSEYLEMIFDAFPNAYSEYVDVMKNISMKKIAKEKFNGQIVSGVTGLQHKELGEFMKYIKSLFWFRDENVVYFTQTQIEDRIAAHFTNWKPHANQHQKIN